MWFILLFFFGILFYHSFSYFPFTSILFSFLLFVFLLKKKEALLTFALIIGIFYAIIRSCPPIEIPYTPDILKIQGECTSFPAKTSSGLLRQTFYVKEGLKELEDIEISLISETGLEPGNEYIVYAKLLKSNERFNPGIKVNNEIYAIVNESIPISNKNKSINLKIEEIREGINKYLEKHFPYNSYTFLASITTGHKSVINNDVRDAFNKSGLAHILSISGTHFSLLSVLIFGIFRLLFRLMPYRLLQKITIYLTPSQASAILCFPFLVFYLLLSGENIPAVRSFIMTVFFLIGLLSNRKSFWLSSIFLAAFIIVILEPESLFSLSFQLSFIAVLSIGFAIQNSRRKTDKNKIINYIKKALLMTLAASIATAPLTAYYFHYFSIISPLSNLLITPIIGFTIIPLSVIFAFIFIITGYYPFTGFLSLLTEKSMYLVDIFSKLPYSSINIPDFPPALLLLFYLLLIPYVIFKNKRYLLFLPFLPFVIWFFISLSYNKGMSITFLDVGQGDSAVVELPDNKIMVIDTGKTGKEVSAFLKYIGKEKIDILVISHAHPDHIGGIDFVVNNFKVNEIWVNGRIILSDKYHNITHRSLERGDVIEFPEYKILVLHPYKEFYTFSSREYDSANNESLVLKIGYNNKSFLFTGDIEIEAEDDLNHLGKWLKSDVIKIPHHGAKTSADKYFFSLVSPKIAIISAGRNNSFGHPHSEMLEAINNSKVLRTDVDGAIKITATSDSIETKTYSDFQIVKTNSILKEIKNIKNIFSTW